MSRTPARLLVESLEDRRLLSAGNLLPGLNDPGDPAPPLPSPGDSSATALVGPARLTQGAHTPPADNDGTKGPGEYATPLNSGDTGLAADVGPKAPRAEYTSSGKGMIVTPSGSSAKGLLARPAGGSGDLRSAKSVLVADATSLGVDWYTIKPHPHAHQPPAAAPAERAPAAPPAEQAPGAPPAAERSPSEPAAPATPAPRTAQQPPPLSESALRAPAQAGATPFEGRAPEAARAEGGTPGRAAGEAGARAAARGGAGGRDEQQERQAEPVSEVAVAPDDAVRPAVLELAPVSVPGWRQAAQAAEPLLELLPGTAQVFAVGVEDLLERVEGLGEHLAASANDGGLYAWVVAATLTAALAEVGRRYYRQPKKGLALAADGALMYFPQLQ